MTAKLARAICEICGHLRDTLFRCGAGGLLLGVGRFFELREIERCQDLSAVFVPFLCHAVDDYTLFVYRQLIDNCIRCAIAEREIKREWHRSPPVAVV
jgi:hypothetical protein